MKPYLPSPKEVERLCLRAMCWARRCCWPPTAPRRPSWPPTRAAIELAEGTGSELHVVYVEPLPDFMKNGDGTPGYDRGLYEVIEEKARETLRKLNWRVKVAGGTVAEAHLRLGGVAEEIVGLADELDAGLVVVGSRGLGRLRRTLAGSVSESVFRHAHCPGMVVRAKVNPPNRRGG